MKRQKVSRKLMQKENRRGSHSEMHSGSHLPMHSEMLRMKHSGSVLRPKRLGKRMAKPKDLVKEMLKVTKKLMQHPLL